jgi:uncharacterized OB-fold protein
LNRRRDMKIRSYEKLKKYKNGSVRMKLAAPRIVARIEPYNGRSMTFTLCNGCQRVFYPARDRCLEYDCKGPVEQRTLPLNARLLSAKKLTLRDRFTSNFDILKQGKVLIVDATLSELVPGTELEALIRKIDDEGKNGLIIYGPTYRPVFRTKALLKKAEAATVLAS